METIALGNDDEHQIEVKPITLICKGASEVSVQYKYHLPLDLEACLS